MSKQKNSIPIIEMVKLHCFACFGLFYFYLLKNGDGGHVCCVALFLLCVVYFVMHEDALGHFDLVKYLL